MTRACECLGISRRRVKYVSRQDDGVLVKRMMELVSQHRRAGCRQLRRLLKLEGIHVNLKRVRRLCREHGLLLKQKRRRKRLGIGAGIPCGAEYPNHVWAWDFVEDRTETGRKLRILTIVDEFTRRCIEVEVEHRMNAKFVAKMLLKLFAMHGVPKFIRSDNGPEFIAKFLMNVMKIHGIEARHIDPGSPWQNGKNERFNGTLRDECLNQETFHHRDHARAVVKLFKRHYNEDRPHSSLATKEHWAITPSAFYEKWQREHSVIGFADPGSARTRDLSHECHRLLQENEKGLNDCVDQPSSRMAIHVGAPVASQQSRILRVDQTSVTESPPPGTFPADNQQERPKT